MLGIKTVGLEGALRTRGVSERADMPGIKIVGPKGAPRTMAEPHTQHYTRARQTRPRPTRLPNTAACRTQRKGCVQHKTSPANEAPDITSRADPSARHRLEGACSGVIPDIRRRDGRTHLDNTFIRTLTCILNRILQLLLQLLVVDDPHESPAQRRGAGGLSYAACCSARAGTHECDRVIPEHGRDEGVTIPS